jgi:hypothetical protein
MIRASDLQPLNLLERKARVLEAINQTGVALQKDEPSTLDPDFGARVARLQSEVGLSAHSAALAACLEKLPDRGPETNELLAQILNAPTTGVPNQLDQLLEGLGV